MPPIPPEGLPIAKKRTKIIRLKEIKLQQEEKQREAETLNLVNEFAATAKNEEPLKEKGKPSPEDEETQKVMEQASRAGVPVFAAIKRLQNRTLSHNIDQEKMSIRKEKEKEEERARSENPCRIADWNEAFHGGLKKLRRIDPGSEEFKLLGFQATELCQTASEMMESMKRQSDGLQRQLSNMERAMKNKEAEAKLEMDVMNLYRVEERAKREELQFLNRNLQGEIDYLRQMVKVKEDMLSCIKLRNQLLNSKKGNASPELN